VVDAQEDLAHEVVRVEERRRNRHRSISLLEACPCNANEPGSRPYMYRSTVRLRNQVGLGSMRATERLPCVRVYDVDLCCTRTSYLRNPEFP
jgi:hypothetical protein